MAAPSRARDSSRSRGRHPSDAHTTWRPASGSASRRAGGASSGVHLEGSPRSRRSVAARLADPGSVSLPLSLRTLDVVSARPRALQSRARPPRARAEAREFLPHVTYSESRQTSSTPTPRPTSRSCRNLRPGLNARELARRPRGNADARLGKNLDGSASPRVPRRKTDPAAAPFPPKSKARVVPARSRVERATGAGERT